MNWWAVLGFFCVVYLCATEPDSAVWKSAPWYKRVGVISLVSIIPALLLGRAFA